MTESERLSRVKRIRRQTPCLFRDGLSQDEFLSIVERSRKKFRRIKKIEVNNACIKCVVESQTGFSSWNFSLDFNNWGHITERYWYSSDNSDSTIPVHLGELISSAINENLLSKGIRLKDYAKIVSENEELGTDKGLDYLKKPNIIKRFFLRKEVVTISYDSEELEHEHLFPVISLLKSNGFKNITTISIEDIDGKSNNYPYEVERVIIGGQCSFVSGETILSNIKIEIAYHDKKYITMPFSERELKHLDYIAVKQKLLECGFTHIVERKVEDLRTGWVVKFGSVKSILVGNDAKTPIIKGKAYVYDTSIEVRYHAFK